MRISLGNEKMAAFSISGFGINIIQASMNLILWKPAGEFL